MKITTIRPVALSTYTDPCDPQSPWVLSYFAQRRIAGWIGIALPFVVLLLAMAIDHIFTDSISASYYTIGRNYFVGSLCAVGIFLISGVGYDEDRILSFTAGAMAFAVAFSPCKNPNGPQPFDHSDIIHGIAASLLFLDLAWMCAFRFTRTGNQQSPTESPQSLTARKRQRNGIFRFCGGSMFVTLIGYAITDLILHHLHKDIPHLLFGVEAICLWLFGWAWLVKGQQFFADADDFPVAQPIYRRSQRYLTSFGYPGQGGSTMWSGRVAVRFQEAVRRVAHIWVRRVGGCL